MNARVRFSLLTLITIAAVVLTASLGRWQLSRAAQKIALQAAVDAQSAQPSLDTSVLTGANAPANFINRSATLEGEWVSPATIYLDNRQMDGNVGFYVMTPLLLKGSKTAIMVQRGWIPRNMAQRTVHPVIETPAANVQVSGRIAGPPSRLYELTASDTGAIRQNLDLAQYGGQIGLSLLPVTLIQTGAASEGLLRNWPTVTLGVDRHYGYAFQWFALSVLFAGLYLWFCVVRPSLNAVKESAPHV